jgi:hypothetical protein
MNLTALSFEEVLLKENIKRVWKQNVLFGPIRGAIIRKTEKGQIRNFTILNPHLNLYVCKIKEVKERGMCNK